MGSFQRFKPVQVEEMCLWSHFQLRFVAKAKASQFQESIQLLPSRVLPSEGLCIGVPYNEQGKSPNRVWKFFQHPSLDAEARFLSCIRSLSFNAARFGRFTLQDCLGGHISLDT